MAICYVFGAGDCEVISVSPCCDDLVIAADGGLNHLNNFNIEPDIIIGDFDSFGSIPQGKNVIALKPEKDVTDMYAAVEAGIKQGFDEFVLLGATGGRFDHTLANIQLIAMLSEKGFKASLVNGSDVITCIHNGSFVFSAKHTGFISVFAHSDVCKGVTVKGLKYKLEDAELKNNFALGVSNEFIGEEAEVSVSDGTLVLIFKKY